MTSLEQLDVDISESSDARTSSSPANSRSTSACIELHTVTTEVDSENSSAPSIASTAEVASSRSPVQVGSTDQLNTVPSDRPSCTEVNFRVRTNSVQKVSKKESTISRFKFVEVIGLVVIVLVLLAVFMIPTIFYVKPPLQLEQVSEC